MQIHLSTGNAFQICSPYGTVCARAREWPFFLHRWEASGCGYRQDHYNLGDRFVDSMRCNPQKTQPNSRSNISHMDRYSYIGCGVQWRWLVHLWDFTPEPSNPSKVSRYLNVHHWWEFQCLTIHGMKCAAECISHMSYSSTSSLLAVGSNSEVQLWERDHGEDLLTI